MLQRTQLVSLLRSKTQCSISQALKAINTSNGSYEHSHQVLAEILSKDSIKKAEKASTRPSGKEGLIGSLILHSGYPITSGKPALNRSRGGICEINCETDFVARTTTFKTLVQDVTHSLAFLTDSNNGFKNFDDLNLNDLPLISSNPLSTEPSSSTSLKDAINDSISKLGENITFKRFSNFSLNDPLNENLNILGQFIHGKLSNEENKSSPVQLGSLATLVNLSYNNTNYNKLYDQNTVENLSKVIARQLTAFPVDEINNEFYDQPLIGSSDESQTVKSHLDNYNCYVDGFRRWNVGQE